MPDQQLIADIYRAASGLRSWPDVLAQLARSLDGSDAQLRGMRKPGGEALFVLRPEDGMVGADGMETPPDAAQLLSMPCGVVQPAPRRLRAKFVDAGDRIAVVELNRHRGQPAFVEPDRLRLERLAVHLASAFEIVAESRRLHHQALVGRLLLSRSGHPCLLLSRDGAIQFVNGAAQRFMKARHVLLSRSGQLRARCSSSDAALQLALEALSRPRDELQRRAPGPTALGLRDVDSGRPVPACLWPLRAENPSGVPDFEADVLLILSAPGIGRAPDAQILGALFGVTAAEARVAAGLIANQPPKLIAGTLKLSVPTVRHHIRHLLEKTGAADLRDLAHLLTRASEIAGS